MVSQPKQNDDEWEYEYDYNDTEVSYSPRFDGAICVPWRPMWSSCSCILIAR